jgi:hypothetical protein
VPVVPMILAVGCAIAIDTIFGIYAVLKQQGRKKFKSRIAGTGIASKLITYTLSVVLVFIIDKNFLTEFIDSYFEMKIEYLPTKIVSALFIFIEMVSTYENFNKILGYDLIDKIKSVASRTKDVKDSIKKLEIDFDKDYDKDSK